MRKDTQLRKNGIMEKPSERLRENISELGHSGDMMQGNKTKKKLLTSEIAIYLIVLSAFVEHGVAGNSLSIIVDRDMLIN